MSDNDDKRLETPGTGASLFDHRDRERLRNYVRFAAGSARRHRILVAAVFVSIMGCTIGSFFLLPKTYHVETKALAQPSSALSVRGDGPGAESLTRVAADTVLRRDNLLALVQQLDLLQYTKEHRAPAQRARDAVMLFLRGHEDSESDRTDALVKRLGEKFAVWTSDGGPTAGGSTVTIAIDWQDGPMACKLVDAAQRAFLDARYAREVTALAEAIEILQRHTATLRADVDEAVAAVEAMRAARDAPGGASPPAPTSARPRMVSSMRAVSPPRTLVPDPALERLQSQLQAKVRSLEELEDLRRRRLSELQARLAEARTTYTESHPAITDLKQAIAALSVDSPQVASLRLEAASLKSDIDAQSASASTREPPAMVWTTAPAGTTAGTGAAPPQLPGDVLRLSLDLREDRDPGMVYARGQLRDAMDKYASLRTQIQTAQIELETAQAAFKYRYTVVTPAHLPRAPDVPNVPLVTLAAFVAAILCSLLSGLLADIRRGRILERWQVERLLERPILADITLPVDLEKA